MSAVERPNRNALQQALDIFRDAMRPFIVHSLKSVPGWQVDELILDALNPNQAAQVQQNLRSGDIQAAIDIGDFPPIINRNWREAFGQRFSNDRSVQNKIWLIKESRDRVAHPGLQDLDTEYTRAHLYYIADVLGVINQPSQRQAVETIRDQLLARDGPADTPEQAETNPATTNGRRAPRLSSNLAPWREVIKPSPDVSQGTFRQAEFAADLQQVHDGRANATEYGNPVSFFNHTYITPGLRTLLVNTLQRLSTSGGDPVIQTKTGFGGGKTHSLIALYHLVNDVGALVNASEEADARRTSAEIRAMMQDAGLEPAADFRAEIAVLDGTHLSPTDTTVTKETGDPLNTLWGEMAYQLGGQQGYEIVGAAARKGTAPGGSQLDELFRDGAARQDLVVHDHAVAARHVADESRARRLLRVVGAPLVDDRQVRCQADSAIVRARPSRRPRRWRPPSAVVEVEPSGSTRRSAAAPCSSSTGMLKKPWIWPACRSIGQHAGRRPATSMKLAISRALRSGRAAGPSCRSGRRRSTG